MNKPDLASVVFLAAFASAFSWAQGPAQLPGLDLSGYWVPGGNQDAGLGTAAGELVDYGGIPVNEADRLFALAYSASRLTLPQHQCTGYVPPYMFVAPGDYRFAEERDPYTQKVIAIRMRSNSAQAYRTIWLDGRPAPPPYAAHTWEGFAHGKIEGNVLSVVTTNLKRGQIRANGVVQSDQATVLEYFIQHGNRITYFSVTTDPVYLAAPLIKTSTLLRNTRDPNNWLQPCDDGEVILDRPNDQVQNYLWGQHPFLREYSQKHNVPLLGALGGPETVHPEFAAKLKDAPSAEAAAKVELVPSSAPQASRAINPDPHDGEIHVLHVQGDVYMLVGDGGNIAVQTGEEGALLVDAGAGKLSAKIVEAVQKISPKAIQFIINTSFHPEHTGGNAALRVAGEDYEFATALFFSRAFADAGKGATIIGHQNVENRMSAPTGSVAPTPSEGWPTDTYSKGRRRKIHNGEAVEIFYEPNAITDGDSIVQFRRSDVIVTGDIVDTTAYPFIDVKNGGSVLGEIAALNNILDRTVSHREEGGTMIIPGHGRLCDEWEVTEYRDMMVIIRDRVQAMIAKGATLAQVQAARPTADYDTRYGVLTGPWTTNMFVEAVYTSLKQAAAATVARKGGQ
jgi:glyoxylase-like metal-dependent hydrolase (beta-lactamase superfamily II)